MLDCLFTHIGMSRTGTTLHQRVIFPHHDAISYIGKPWPTKAIRDVAWDLACSSDRFFDPVRIAASLDDAAQACARGKLPEARGRPLISEEAFWSRHSVPVAILADRLRLVTQRPKVILTLRNQSDVFRSLAFSYNNWKREIVTSVEIVAKEIQLSHCRITYANHLYYDEAAKTLYDKLGSENVLILLYEEMCKQPESFYQKLGKFIGVNPDVFLEAYRKSPRNVNASGDTYLVSFANFRSRFLKLGRMDTLDKVGSALFRMFSIDCRVTRTLNLIDDKIPKMYAPSNRALSKLTGIDLGSYGYPI